MNHHTFSPLSMLTRSLRSPKKFMASRKLNFLLIACLCVSLCVYFSLKGTVVLVSVSWVEVKVTECLLMHLCSFVCICVVCVFRWAFVGPKPCWSSMPDGGVLSCTRACAAEALCCSPMALWELLLLTFSLRCWLTSSASLAEEGPAGPWTGFFLTRALSPLTRVHWIRGEEPSGIFHEIQDLQVSCNWTEGFPWFLMVPVVVSVMLYIGSEGQQGHDPVTLYLNTLATFRNLEHY